MSILKVGDRVIIIERGPDFGKMCNVIEAPQTNELLAVRIELVNPHDHFRSGDIFSISTEKWINPRKVKLYTGEEKHQ